MALLDHSRAVSGLGTWSGRALERGCVRPGSPGRRPRSAAAVLVPGDPCPDYNDDERKGDNLYTASVMALDPAIGKLKWHYQSLRTICTIGTLPETPVLMNALFRGHPAS